MYTPGILRDTKRKKMGQPQEPSPNPVQTKALRGVAKMATWQIINQEVVTNPAPITQLQVGPRFKLSLTMDTTEEIMK